MGNLHIIMQYYCDGVCKRVANNLDDIILCHGDMWTSRRYSTMSRFPPFFLIIFWSLISIMVALYLTEVTLWLLYLSCE